MRIAITFVFALMVLCVVGNSTVSAQPSVAVYFEWGGGTEATGVPCPGPGLDTLYVVAQNLNTFFNAIEFQIDYVPAFGAAYFSWVGELTTAGTKVGNSPTGVALGWGLPLNGFNPQVVLRPLVFWNCGACLGPDVVKVNPNPFTADPTIIAVEFPSLVKIPMIGLTSTVCDPVATKQSTWGEIKAIYE